MAGRPPGAQNKDKPFRDALRVESKLAENGEPTPAPEGSLRYIARQLLLRAGGETQAAKEVADRMDGKAPQAIIGGDEDDNPVNVVARIERVIVGNAKD
jgi:hypothetical protein